MMEEDTKNQWTVKHSENTFKYLLNDLIPQIKLIIEQAHDIQTVEYTGLLELAREQERQVQQKSFKMVVVGSMKCGKSTFLNCILQATIFPENTVPETTAQVAIIHCTNLTVPQLYSVNEDGSQKDCLVQGEQEIYNYLKDFNSYLQKLDSIPSTPSPNGFPDCRQLLLKAHIPALTCFNSDFITFSLMDTSGFNEATQSLLQTADAIVYLLDINRFGGNDEFQLLSDIVKLRSDLLKDHRFYFLYNKADITRLMDGSLDENEFQNNRDYVCSQLQKISPQALEIEQKNSYAISSLEFITSTLLLSGKVNHLPRNHYNWIASKMFGAMHRIPKNFPRVIEETDRQFLEDMKRNSNIGEVENNLFEAITLQAPRLFAITTISSLKVIVKEMADSLKIHLKSVMEDQKYLKTLIQLLHDALFQIQDSKNDMMKELIKFQKDYTQNHENIAIHLKDTLILEITKLLDKVSTSYENQNIANEETLKEMKFCWERIASIIADHKTQADHELHKTIHKYDKSCREIVFQFIKNRMIGTLKKSFPSKDFSEIVNQLKDVPALSYHPKKTCEADQIDLDAIRSGSVYNFEETITQTTATIKPATYEKRSRTIGTIGRSTVIGFLVGLFIAVTVGGPITTILGSLLGAFLSTPRKMEHYDVEVEKAETIYEEKTETVQRFKIDYVKIRGAFEYAIRTQVHDSFKRCLQEEGTFAFELIQRNVQEQYINQIKRLQEGLQNDLNKNNLNILQALRDDCNLLEEKLSQPIELIIPLN